MVSRSRAQSPCPACDRPTPRLAVPTLHAITSALSASSRDALKDVGHEFREGETPMKLAACIALACLSLSPMALAQAPGTRPGPATPVEVVNTTPLAVTGMLEITTATPLPVVAVQPDDSVLNAFQKRLAFAPGNPQSDKEFLVPAGKRLVIQSVSANADTTADQKVDVFFTVTLGGALSIVQVPMALAGRDPGTFPRDSFHGLHQTRWVADGGTKVVFSCQHVSFTVSNCGLDVSVSGFLVTMP